MMLPAVGVGDKPDRLFELDEQQRAVVRHVAGRTRCLLVTGGPGSGKTTALVAAVAQLASQGVGLDSVVVLTHARPAAQRLRREIMAAVGVTQVDLRITTAHGWCQALLNRYGEPSAVPVRLLSAPEQEYRVRELVSAVQWPNDVVQASGTPAFAGQLRFLLARARQLGLDPRDLAAVGRRSGRADWVAAASFFTSYLDVIDAEGVLDYAELVHRCRVLMSDHAVRAGVAAHTRALLVDEFTECDESVVALLRDMWRAGVPVTAFGDPTTQVFGFRGAWPEAVKRFPGEFADASGPAPVITLAGRWRDPARRMAFMAATPDDELTLLAQQLWLAHDEVPWGGMAVIARSGGAGLARIAGGLAAEGIPVTVDGETLALAEVPAVNVILDALRLLVDIFDGADTPAQWMAVLCSPAVGLDEVDLRGLARMSGTFGPGEYSEDWASALLTAIQCRVPLPDDPVAQALTAAVGRLWALAAGLDASTVAPLAWAVWTLGDWPARLRQAAVAQAEGAVAANRDLDALVALFDMAGPLAQRGAEGVAALAELVSQQLVERDRARESAVQTAVTVLSAYRAKGRGWPVVAVVGAVEGAWPSSSWSGALFQPERLAADGQLPPLTRPEQVDADRRLFLLATSRASHRLIVTGAAPAADDVARPSRFLAEAGLMANRWTGGSSQPAAPSARQLVAQLRAAAVDAEAAPGLQQGAMALLRQLRQTSLPDGRPLAPGADPRHWWWVAGPTQGPPLFGPGPVRVSASTLRQLVDCPRAWFLQNRAGASPVPGPQLAYGTLVHALFAACSRAQDGDAVERAVAEAWPAMGFRSDWYADGRREALDLALARFRAWRDGRQRRRLLGTEIDFRHVWTSASGDIEVTGRVDRLEADEAGRLVVIDFKTGQYPDTKRNAVQMGLYAAGARAGVFEGQAPGVRQAGPPELVWPDAEPRRADIGCRVDPVGPDSETVAMEYLDQAGDILRSGRFDAVAGDDCRYCAHLQGCPVQATGVGDG